MNSSTVVDVAKEQLDTDADEHMLSTDVRVCIKKVSARLLTEVMARVPKPDVPMFYDEDREKEYPNPGDPTYLAALEERDGEQTNAAMDALIMFGVELVDPIPDDGWDKKLMLLGTVDLSEYDLDEPIAREFVYKKYIGVSAADMPLLQKASGVIMEDDLVAAEDSFPGDEESSPDQGTEG